MKIKQWRIGRFTFGFITGRGEPPEDIFDRPASGRVRSAEGKKPVESKEKCAALNPETGRYCIMGEHTSDHMDDMFRIWGD